MVERAATSPAAAADSVFSSTSHGMMIITAPFPTPDTRFAI